MARATTRDMTNGSPTKLIFGFFFPLLFGLLLQQVYNMVDTIVVGRFLGVSALAGVGSTGSLSFLVLGFCIGVSNGFAIPVAQKFGERDFQGFKRFVVNAILLSILFSLAVTALVCALCGQMLTWMHTPQDIMADAFGYIFVIFLGIPVVFLYNVLFSIIRSLGDSRTPVLYLLYCSLLNVGLDLLFILVFKMGVAGAAWATVTAQGIAMLLCVNYLRHCDVLVLTRADWHADGQCFKTLIGMGIPMGLQYSITAIGCIIMQASVNGLGSGYVASVAAGSKVNQLFCCPFDALGSTMVTYGGQNVGAGKLDRIGQGVKSCVWIGFSYAAVAFGILFFLGGYLVQAFVDASEAETISNAALYLKFNSSSYTLLVLVNVLRFLIQGLGFTKQAVFAGVFEMAARATVGMVLVPAFGYPAACLSDPAAWLAADIFLIPAYFWTLRSLRAQKAAGQGA